MKKIISLALAMLVLLSCALTSCGKSIITIPDGDRSYQIQKSGQKRIITVFENDVEIWETKEKVKSSVDGIDEAEVTFARDLKNVRVIGGKGEQTGKRTVKICDLRSFGYVCIEADYE